MEIISAATLLFLVMDPLGNIPIFLSVLEDVAPERFTTVSAEALPRGVSRPHWRQ